MTPRWHAEEILKDLNLWSSREHFVKRIEEQIRKALSETQDRDAEGAD